MNKIPMTANGAEQLKEELHSLKSVERPRIVSAIKEAREKGDLKENAEYHAAREEQSFMEGRIKDIEAKLSNAHIIDIKTMPVSTKVIFGSTVILVNLDDGKKVTYKLVGEDEADLKVGKISITSPLARALIGKDQDDVIELKMPSGITEYEISKVKYE
ncbi:MAG: transcription elongation factor GreA [Gammaproteobacteria bacterium]|jgi:transcription elongation factor GreA|nr:transcription elongation factor GreA [Gammaproteobacteria bacterium]MBT4463038.1 transcription elongation factor GreA [Gammaproteobacteria bacterium]MBT4654553.1 transcription elongation factor GreA [Gammaproteobacteria bacterium]MBT5116736.1 transcription elongation factor GreA [Gammaproteobacteria bacterium]MBT7323318.1 transcription elongation factor GreA [Gammaproteobacteria bacterium]